MSYVTGHMSQFFSFLFFLFIFLSFWTKWWSLSVEGLLPTGTTPSSCNTLSESNALFGLQTQCEEKSKTMQPMVGGKLSKSEESNPNARETLAPESVQFKEK